MKHLRGKRLLTAGAFAAAVVLIVLAYIISSSRYHRAYPPGYATGDPLDIRLYGIRPGTSLDIFDASGKKIGDTFGSPHWDMHYSQGIVRRTYIFNLPDGEGETVFSRTSSVYPSGETDSQYISVLERGVDYSGNPDDRRVFCSLDGPDKYPTRWLRWLLRWLPFRAPLSLRPLTDVDITLGFWQGPRGKADVTFLGPFTAGKAADGDSKGKSSLVLTRYYNCGGDWGVRGHFSSAAPLRNAHDILIYDKAGRRAQASMDYVGYSMRTTFAFFSAPNRDVDDIAAVTVGETMRERTFHRVPVAIPNLKEHTYPEYLDAISERLGLAGGPRSALNQFNIQSPEEALKIIDLVRGGDAMVAWDMIEYMLDPQGGRDRLAPEDEERLKRAAGAWSNADDAQIRRLGIVMGLAISPKDFIPAVLTRLEAGDAFPGIRDGLVKHAGDLSPADIRRIADLLRRSPRNVGLMECITANALPEATDALRELASSDRTWLWWRALREKKTLAALGPAESWPADLKARAFIAAGLSIAATSARREDDVKPLLPALVTKELMDADPSAFTGIYRLMVAVCDRATAESVTIALLKAGGVYNSSIAVLVKALNLWNGVNIAALGSDLDADIRNERGLNWRQAARDAVEWLDTGAIREDVPAGYKVAAEDLRLVAFSPSDKEGAIIAIWRHAQADGEFSRVSVVDEPKANLVFSVVPTILSLAPKSPVTRTGRPTAPPTPDYESRFYLERYGDDGEVRTGTGGGQGFAMSELPVKLDRGGEWDVTIERADSPQSVLSGTKVFDDWWKAHAPVASVAPATRSAVLSSDVR